MYQKVAIWIENIITSHTRVLAVALRKRSKFEGWLKVELADQALEFGASQIEFEVPLPENNGQADLSFTYNNVKYYVELKTPNTNWRLPGVLNLHRPITNNIDSIISDGRKLKSSNVHGIVAFVMFPIPVGDNRWLDYYKKIANELGMIISPNSHTKQITIPIDKSNNADMIIASFPAD